MKTLYLLRHAKSSWDDPSLRDFDRPLAPRGRLAAPAVARHMQEQGYLPQVVLSSASRRTRETWSLVSSVLGGDPEVRFQRSLYMADAADMLMEIHVQTNATERLLMIGHNPSMEELAVYLAGSGDADALRSMTRKFPTAALAVLEHRGDRWSELTRGSCHLVEFVRPKDL